MPRKRKQFDIEKAFEDTALIERAVGDAVVDALRQHKQAGNPVPEWRDGRVVWIPASKIRIPRTNGSGRRGKSASRSRKK
jgi:hypothetical protein